jgi:ABC-2 type transport system ATP-binding protein
MVDVEELCERVLLIDKGRTLIYGRLAQIKQERKTRRVLVTAEKEPAQVPGIVQKEYRNGTFDYLMNEQTRPDEILRSFLDSGISVEKYEVALPSLNDIFIEEVGRARRSH